MIKAMFFDLDGTLLNSKKVISPKTKLELIKCREKGVKLFIATARPPLLDKMLSWGSDTLSLFDGGSYCNGACTIIKENREYTFIEKDVVNETISAVCEYKELNIALQLEEEKHAFRFPLTDSGYKSWGVTRREALGINDAGALNTLKILIFYDNLVDSLQPVDIGAVNAVNKLCHNKAKVYITDKGKCVQIMGSSVSKYRGVEEIRRQMGFEKDEIAVFGDDVNDVEMLSAYKYSFAMGNAVEAAKKAASFVILDNDSEGIYYAIQKSLF